MSHDLIAETAEKAIAAAVLMGTDMDTIGAVASGIAGIRFGHDALPGRWIKPPSARDELETFASKRLALDPRTSHAQAWIPNSTVEP